MGRIRLRHTANLAIWKPMTSSALQFISILPLLWIHNAKKRLGALSPILGISSITLQEEGSHLVPGNLRTDTRFKPTQEGVARVRVIHATADAKTQADIQRIWRYLSLIIANTNPENATAAVARDAKIGVADGKILTFWIEELKAVLLREPTLCVRFTVFENMTKDVLKRGVEEVIRLYEAVWPSMRAAPVALPQAPFSEFFSMRFNYDASSTHVEFMVTLPSKSPFDKVRVLVIDNREYGSPGRESPHVMLDCDCPRPSKPLNQPRYRGMFMSNNVDDVSRSPEPTSSIRRHIPSSEAGRFGNVTS